MEYLKDKINELITNSNNNNIRDLYRKLNKFKSDYQPRINLVKVGKVHLLEDSHNILIGGRTTSLRYLMYIGSVILGR
jgi:hypothetical protein